MSLKQKWIDALRSGKFKQAQKTLKLDHGGGHESFCCLGVLCEISALGRWTKHHNGTYQIPINEQTRFFGSTIPDYMLSKIGLNSIDQNALVRMNDSGESFEAIANHIENEIDMD